jgi:16S rRNA processing protein RimM
VKPHGLRGEVVVALVSNRPERSAPGAVFSSSAGELRVASSRPFKEGWLMTLDGVTTREQAEALRATVLYGHPLHDEDAWWVHELVGALVVTEDGAEHGSVRAVVAGAAGDLLELGDGTLVPLRFVVERGPGRLVVAGPDGLFDTTG